MSTAIILAIFCLLSVVASLAGGWIPLVVQLTHRRMQIAISFVSGMILGIGVLHLLPHGFALLGSIDRAAYWLLAGFLFMFFLERFFEFHHHDVDDEAAHLAGQESKDHAHLHSHESHAHEHHHPAAPTTSSWAGATIGLSLHGLVDGVAMAAAVHAESHGAALWAGIGTALAVALHKPFDSLTIGALMAAAGKPRGTRVLVNLLYAMVTPLGVLLFSLLASHEQLGERGLGEALAFAAGAFICIATGDLLPELQFHRHDRVGLSVALLLGIGLAWSTGLLEGDLHESHSSGEAHSHDDDDREHRH